jgi:hypothetical protein
MTIWPVFDDDVSIKMYMVNTRGHIPGDNSLNSGPRENLTSRRSEGLPTFDW